MPRHHVESERCPLCFQRCLCLTTTRFYYQKLMQCSKKNEDCISYPPKMKELIHNTWRYCSSSRSILIWSMWSLYWRARSNCSCLSSEISHTVSGNVSLRQRHMLLHSKSSAYMSVSKAKYYSKAQEHWWSWTSLWNLDSRHIGHVLLAVKI